MAAATSKPCSRSIPRTSWISYQGSCISPNEAMKSQLETVGCFLLLLIMIINLYIITNDCSSWYHPCHHSLILKGTGNFIVRNVTLIGHLTISSLSVRNINLHIASWAQCHSWHGLPSWNYLLLCASRLSQLKEIKPKIDWRKKDRPKYKRTIQTWIPSFWETSRIWNTVKDFNVH